MERNELIETVVAFRMAAYRIEMMVNTSENTVWRSLNYSPVIKDVETVRFIDLKKAKQ
jgi:hypothetical protein